MRARISHFRTETNQREIHQGSVLEIAPQVIAPQVIALPVIALPVTAPHIARQLARSQRLAVSSSSTRGQFAPESTSSDR